MKKIIATILAIFIAVSSFSVFADSGTIVFDQNNSIVKVKYVTNQYDQFKVRIKNGNNKYFYNLYDADEVFPLQMGDGTYTVSVFKRTSPGSDKYQQVLNSSKSVKLKPNQVYLQSIQNIDWNNKSKAIDLAKRLSLDKAKGQDDFQKIYDEIVRTIVYDDYKAANVNSRYIPVIDNTLKERKGICYDYSALMAAMMRSLGIPTKMVHGYSSEVEEGVYHAWNEVLLNGTWTVIDTTVDACYIGTNLKPQVAKPKQNYKPTKEF